MLLGISVFYTYTRRHFLYTHSPACVRSRLFIFMCSNVSVVNTMIFHGCRVEIFSFGIFPIYFRLSLVLVECSRNERLELVQTACV